MRIYSKASPMFKNPDNTIRAEDKNKFFRCKPGFQTVPDWARNDKTFQSSVAAGIIQEIAVQPQIVVPAKQLSKADQKALAKSVGHDIELIDACANADDLASIRDSIVNKDNADVIEAITEKAALFEKAQ